MPHPPEVASAYDAGGWTAVLELAQRHQMRLQHEWADLTRDLELRYVCAADRTAPPSPLELQLNRLRREMLDWDYIEDHARPHAANEAHGWAIRSDGSNYKVLGDGSVISTTTRVVSFDYSPPKQSACTPPRRVRPLTRRRGAGRPRAQATRSGARSGDGPDDDGPGEPPAAPLRLAPIPRAVLTFGCLSAADRGEVTR